MAIASKLTFSEPYKHGKIQFLPGPVYGFEHPDAEAFFSNFGAVASEDEPMVVIAADEIEIDPETIFGSGPRRGEKVLGD